MRFKLALITSIFSILSPICGILAMCAFEREFAEAIMGGLLIGCLIGTVLGIVSLVLNKGKRKSVKILSIIPMIPLVSYILLLIPWLLCK